MIYLLGFVRKFIATTLKRGALNGYLSARNYAQSNTLSDYMCYYFNSQRPLAEALDGIIPALQIEAQSWY